jgi:hypothetical protein
VCIYTCVHIIYIYFVCVYICRYIICLCIYYFFSQHTSNILSPHSTPLYHHRHRHDSDQRPLGPAPPPAGPRRYAHPTGLSACVSGVCVCVCVCVSGPVCVVHVAPTDRPHPRNHPSIHVNQQTKPKPTKHQKEHFGTEQLSGKTVAWVGDGNNVLHDLALAAARLGAYRDIYIHIYIYISFLSCIICIAAALNQPPMHLTNPPTNTNKGIMNPFNNFCLAPPQTQTQRHERPRGLPRGVRPRQGGDGGGEAAR